MLILLPPSEGKCSPMTTDRLDLASLSFPALTAARRRALRTLESLCRDEAEALHALRLGAGQRDEVAQNRFLRRAPVDAAVRVYTGVLYEALAPLTLTAGQLDRLNEQVAIASGLWGLVRPLDPIPAYRLAAGGKIPGLDPALWRTPVARALRAAGGPVIDLRSGAYQALAPVPADVECAVGRVLLQRDGRRTVVSHHNKATKGRLARAVARTRRPLRTVDDFAEVAESIGLRAELHHVPTRPGATGIDLIATSL